MNWSSIHSHLLSQDKKIHLFTVILEGISEHTIYSFLKELHVKGKLRNKSSFADVILVDSFLVINSSANITVCR